MVLLLLTGNDASVASDYLQSMHSWTQDCRDTAVKRLQGKVKTLTVQAREAALAPGHYAELGRDPWSHGM